jgi:hypothetical protein
MECVVVLWVAGGAAEDGQSGLEGVLDEAEHQVYPARPGRTSCRPSTDTGTATPFV